MKYVQTSSIALERLAEIFAAVDKQKKICGWRVGHYVIHTVDNSQRPQEAMKVQKQSDNCIST